MRIYRTIDSYKFIKRTRVGEIVDNLDAYKNFMFIVDDGDEPEPINLCIAYLEDINRNKKVSILEFLDEGTEWVEEEGE